MVVATDRVFLSFTATTLLLLEVSKSVVNLSNRFCSFNLDPLESFNELFSSYSLALASVKVLTAN